MAILTNAERVAIWVEFNQDTGGSISVVKADLRAALDAADAWVDANAASFNAAIPQPARAELTTRQKARLLLLVVQRRFLAVA